MPSNAQTDPRHDFIPAREANLLAWSRNFRDEINAPPGPGRYGISVGQAAQYSVLHDAYSAAYTAANNPNSNSKSTIVRKNQAKKELKANARLLARLVRATPGVTMAQRAELGLTVPDPHLTPTTRPSDPPELYVLPSLGRTVRIRLRDKAAPDRLGRPPGVAGAAVLSYVARMPGETQAPGDISQWTFHGNATRRYFDVRIASTVPAGAKMWIAAMWYSTRGVLGPASTAQAIRVGEGVSSFRNAA